MIDASDKIWITDYAIGENTVLNYIDLFILCLLSVCA